MDSADDQQIYTPTMTPIPAMILAGGRGMRLGGRDKTLCHLGDSTLLQHCLTRLKPHCTPVALNANGPSNRFAPFDVHVVPDSLEGQLGPLAGVLASMEWAAGLGHTEVITIAVDTPFFPHDLVKRFMADRVQGQVALAGTCDADGKLWRHPTFGVWPVVLRDQLRTDLLAGTRKVTQWTEAQGATTILFETSNFDPFFNINTPEDLRQAQQLIARAL